MDIQQLQTQLKSLGYGDEYKKDSSKRLIVYMEASERVAALKDISSTFKGRYTPAKNGTGWRSSVGAALLPGGLVVLAKPKTKGTVGNIAALDARDFYKLAKPGKFDFHGEHIDVVTFKSPGPIEDSIIKGAADNRMLGAPYAEAFEDFFKTGKITWADGTPRPVINKLGVYVGEVIIGWVFLNNKPKLYRDHFANNPFRGTAVAFHLPTDPAFSGVDSFVEMKDGSFYAISSKFGAGAKASFFTNLFEKGIKKRQKLTNSYFKTMCDFAADNNIQFNKSRDFIYNFGVREILKLDSTQISDPVEVFNHVRQNKQSDIVNIVASVIENQSDNNLIKDALPDSISAYFNRTIADNLNNDDKSIKQMTEILAGKDYWQANLDIAKWTNGSLKFRFINSGEAKLNIIGSKSSISDVTSKQGWVNYELKY